MRIFLLIGCLALCTVSCRKKNAIPDNIIEQKKMQAILWDLMRADQFLTDYVINWDTSFTSKAGNIKLYQQVLDIHKITKEEFTESFAFYRSHPAILKAIMDSISKPVLAPVPPETLPSRIVPDTMAK